MKGKQPPSFSSGENANQRLPAPQWCWLAHLNLCFTFVTNEIMYNFLFFFFSFLAILSLLYFTVTLKDSIISQEKIHS